ncbi:MAG: hypothetical protein PVI91_06620 [Gammaproteobacteria bacterium]|jgi:hypothetical protein
MVSRPIYLGGVILAAGLLLLSVFPLPELHRDPLTQVTSTRNKRLPLLIKEFRYTGQDQNRLVHVLEARELVVQPRRFAVFNIKSINEAVLRAAHFEVHFYEDGIENTPLFDYQEVQPFTEGSHKRRNGSLIGLVTRVIANGVRYDIFRNEKRKMVLVAEHGVMEKRKSGVEFFHAVIKDSGSDRFIRSRKILWNEHRKVFVIPGAYAMSASGNNTSGEAIEIDLDFTITSASP